MYGIGLRFGLFRVFFYIGFGVSIEGNFYCEVIRKEFSILEKFRMFKVEGRRYGMTEVDEGY